MTHPRSPGPRSPDPTPVSRRSVEDIPPVEIANAAEQVLRQHVAMPLEDLCRETARLFGIKRLGKDVRGGMDEGVNMLLRRGGAKEVGGQVSLGG